MPRQGPPTSIKPAAVIDELRRRIERLLRAQSEIGNFLESPPPELADTIVPSALAERPGTVIGAYKLLEEIGEGGFGVVYMADQQAPVRRRVALKIIKPGMDTKEVLARFEAERQALAMMDHPNIARVLDAGATETGPALFRDGAGPRRSHHGVLRPEQLARPRAARFVRAGLPRRAARPSEGDHSPGHQALERAGHSSRWTCRCPRSSISASPRRWIGRSTEKTLFTRFAEMVGTPLYMSPEQAEMTSLDVDTRSDIYSLGVLLVRTADREHALRPGAAAAGGVRRNPPDHSRGRARRNPAPGLARWAQTRRDGGSSPSDSDGNRLSQLVRGDLDWIVMKALEKDRTRRYETANSLALDVQRYLADEPVEACPPSRRYRLRKFIRRHKAPVFGASAVLLALVAGIIGTTWGMIRATNAESVAVKSEMQTSQALSDKVVALAAAEKSERIRSEELWKSLVAQARALRLSRRSGQRFESLARLQQATGLARTLDLSPANFHEIRNAAIAALAVPDLYLDGPRNTWPADALAVDFDEAHVLYARTDRAGSCSIRRVADDVEICRLPALGRPAQPCLSRDGKYIAITQFNRSISMPTALHVWQLDEAKPRQILSEPKARWVEFRGSQQVALGYNDGSIGLFDLPSARQLSRLAPETITRSIMFALHPTEPLVAVASYTDQVLQLRDLGSGKVLASESQVDRPLALAWHPDGRTLAVGTNRRQICLYDRRTWQVYRTLETDFFPTSMAFDAVGDCLAANEYGLNMELLRVATGERLMKAPSTPSVCRFNRDGLRLAGGVQHGTLGIWRVAGSQEFRTLARSKPFPPNGYYIDVALHPDGRMLACAMTDGFGLWNLENGAEIGFIPSHWSNNRVLFEPSGSLLTLSITGLSRWPISKGSGATGGLSIGPPEPLPLPNGEGLDQSRDGRVTVTCDRAVSTQQPYAGGWILRSDRPQEPIRLDPGADVVHIAVSPDGRWVVTATHVIGLAKIWDARDGRFVRQLADWGATLPRFSPDGRWLSTRLDGGRLFSVGAWEPGLRLGENAVFDPNSKLAAVPTPAGLRLLEVASAREIAVLEDPNLDPIIQVVFTPDGAKLVALSFKEIHVWDLRLIRQQLKEMGLDWHAPEFPPAAASGEAVEPPKVDLRLGDKWVAEPPEDPAEKKPPEPRPKPGS